MTKQSFTIPEGCKAVTVEQVGNQIITTFEPEFKRGDVLICYDKTISADTGLFVFIFKDIVPDNMGNGMCAYVRLSTNRLRLDYEYMFASYWDVLRHATPEEAQLLWDALAKKGKRWNPETMQVEEIKKERWRAENDGIYYSVDISTTRLVYYLEECGDAVDNRNYTSGNYFQTEEQAQRAADRLKAELDKFWEEELR